MIEAAAFPGYWGTPPTIGRVRYTAAPAGDTRANMAEAGEAFFFFYMVTKEL